MKMRNRARRARNRYPAPRHINWKFPRLLHFSRRRKLPPRGPGTVTVRRPLRWAILNDQWWAGITAFDWATPGADQTVIVPLRRVHPGYGMPSGTVTGRIDA